MNENFSAKIVWLSGLYYEITLSYLSLKAKRLLSLFSYSSIIIFLYSTQLLAQDIFLKERELIQESLNGESVIIIASRRTTTDVLEIIDSYSLLYKGNNISPAVFLSENGWYALALGTISQSQCSLTVSAIVNEGVIPPDSYCTAGERFIAYFTIQDGNLVPQIGEFFGAESQPTIANKNAADEINENATENSLADIAVVLEKQGEGYVRYYAKGYFDKINEYETLSLCEGSGVVEKKGINYCVGYFAEHAANNGDAMGESRWEALEERLQQDTLSQEIIRERNMKCDVPSVLSSFESGRARYPSEYNFGKDGQKRIAEQNVGICRTLTDSTLEAIEQARFVEASEVQSILDAIDLRKQTDPIFIVGLEGFFWVAETRLNSQQVSMIPSEINNSNRSRFESVEFWGYIVNYVDDGNRLFADLCDTPQGITCASPTTAVFAPQYNPAFPNQGQVFLDNARGFVERAVREQRGIYVGGLTGVFANTGGFYLDVRRWNTFD